MAAFVELYSNLSTVIEKSGPYQEHTLERLCAAICETTGIKEDKLAVTIQGDVGGIAGKGVTQRVAYAVFKTSLDPTPDLQAELRKKFVKILKSDWDLSGGSCFMLKFVKYRLSELTDEEDEDEDKEEEEEEDEDEDDDDDDEDMCEGECMCGKAKSKVMDEDSDVMEE